MHATYDADLTHHRFRLESVSLDPSGAPADDVVITVRRLPWWGSIGRLLGQTVEGTLVQFRGRPQDWPVWHNEDSGRRADRRTEDWLKRVHARWVDDGHPYGRYAPLPKPRGPGMEQHYRNCAILVVIISSFWLFENPSMRLFSVYFMPFLLFYMVVLAEHMCATVIDYLRGRVNR
jgi:hypothetical protein